MISSRFAKLLVGAVLVAGVPWVPVRGGETPDAHSPAVHLLTKGKLTAEVMDPNHPERYNRGIRFTPVAAVLRVRFDGHSYFHAPEDHDPITDHGGLASEFDLCRPDGPDEDLPCGWLDAVDGEGFVKIGVGVLGKTERYSLLQRGPLLAPAVTQVQWGKDRAAFVQECAGINGYAYRLEAVVSLESTRLFIDWKLTNTGTKPFRTRLYTHNFFRFDDQGSETGYTLEFPYDFAASGLGLGQEQKGREIRFIGPIPRWINAQVPWPADYKGPNSLVLRHHRTGLSICCETSLPSIYTAIHARAGYISPEQFILVALDPGETSTWWRNYGFELK